MLNTLARGTHIGLRGIIAVDVQAEPQHAMSDALLILDARVSKSTAESISCRTWIFQRVRTVGEEETYAVRRTEIST